MAAFEHGKNRFEEVSRCERGVAAEMYGTGGGGMFLGSVVVRRRVFSGDFNTALKNLAKPLEKRVESHLV